MKKIIFYLLVSTLLFSCNDEKKESDTIEKTEYRKIHEKIAIKNGYKQFDSISEIKFTFNVKVNDTLRSQRKWVWNLDSDKIMLTEKDSTMSYIKKDSIAMENEYIDQRFINDSYWLLFPYQLIWSNARISEANTAQAPISGKETQMLTVSYPSEGGYTPGDSYDIYFDKDLLIREWVYKSAGGGREMATTWEDYEDYNGVLISKMHRSGDGSFELFFTDISLEK